MPRFQVKAPPPTPKDDKARHQHALNPGRTLSHRTVNLRRPQSNDKTRTPAHRSPTIALGNTTCGTYMQQYHGDGDGGHGDVRAHNTLPVPISSAMRHRPFLLRPYSTPSRWNGSRVSRSPAGRVYSRASQASSGSRLQGALFSLPFPPLRAWAAVGVFSPAPEAMRRV